MLNDRNSLSRVVVDSALEALSKSKLDFFPPLLSRPMDCIMQEVRLAVVPPHLADEINMQERGFWRYERKGNVRNSNRRYENTKLSHCSLDSPLF